MGNMMEMLVKLAVAALFGGIVGTERQLKGKPAGLKTNMLISVGACFYVVLGINATGGNTNSDLLFRIIAQIITGVGFIGAGTIMRWGNQDEGKKTVHGLTTAAAIWVVSAIGVAVGLGLYLPALVVSVMTFIILFFLSEAELKPRLKRTIKKK